MSDAIKNKAASVRQRLLNLARDRGLEFQRILVLFALERLLYRLSVSPFAGQFIVKGASLFALWLNDPHRQTRDIDLLGREEPSTERLAAHFADLCIQDVPNDGLRFDAASVKAAPIREASNFGGVRVNLIAYLDNARIALQVDIGFGDAAVPEPEEVDFPTLLPEFAAPHLRAYQKETTIAEKLHAIVILERSNSRMKDFFDLYVLSQEFDFTMARLAPAARDAFARRGTPIPTEVPDGLSQDFAQDPAKLSQWKAFLRQNVTPPRNAATLSDVIATVGEFLLPVLASAASIRNNDEDVWDAGGPWRRS
jgi:hypothetical protein